MKFRYKVFCKTCGIYCPSTVSLIASPKYPDGIIYRGVWFGHSFPLGRPIEDFMRGHFGHDFVLKAEKR